MPLGSESVRRRRLLAAAGSLLLGILFLLVGTGARPGPDPPDRIAVLTKKLEELQKKLETAQHDPQRALAIAKEMQAVAAELIGLQKQHAGQIAPRGKGHPWLGAAPPGFLARPVKWTVSQRTEDVAIGRIYTGILPETGEEFVSRYLLFAYSAAGSGALLHRADFSEFRLDAPGDPAAVQIQAMTGFTQRQAPDRKILREDLALGLTGIRRPVHLQIFHPLPGHEGPTNLVFSALSAETADERMPTCEGPGISGEMHDLHEPWFVTPENLERFVQEGGFQRSFAWSTVQPNGKDYLANVVRIRVEIGDPDLEPGLLVVAPKEGFTASGPAGGPIFAPPSRTYTLRNAGRTALDCSVAASQGWLALTPPGGRLGPGQSLAVTLRLTEAAAKLAEGEHQDCVVFTNTTSGLGDTSRSATLLVGGEEQTWRVLLTGMELDDLGGSMLWLEELGKIKQITFDFGVRFDFKLEAEFLLKKSKGQWKYVSGTITGAAVKVSSNFDPAVFSVNKVLPTGTAAFAALKGAGLGGKVDGAAVRLSWPNQFAGATVVSQLKLQHATSEQSQKGYGTSEFVAEEFLPRAAGHAVPLKDGPFSPPPVKKHGAYDQFRKGRPGQIHVNHNYLVQRIE